jgi:nicotinamide-nucleotide adenylyltransferase
MDEYGVVHGRFQPLHDGHVHYIMEGFRRCQHLIVGITNPDPSQVTKENSDLKRHLPSYNPFTFFERLLMVKTTLEEEERVDPDRFLVVPLPIHNLDRWGNYLPNNAVHYLIVTTQWDEIKEERMRSNKFNVEVIGRERYKGITGTEVRQRLINGADWESLVPRPVVKIINEIDPAKRFKELFEKDRLQNGNNADQRSV